MATPKTKAATPIANASPTQLSALHQTLAGGSGNLFQTPDLSSVENAPQISRPPPTVGTPGAYDPLRQTLAQELPDVPQSYIDWWVDNYNAQNAASGGGQGGTPAQLSQVNSPQFVEYAKNDVLRKWSALPQGSGTGEGQGTNRQMYVTADQQRVASANSQSTTNAASRVATQAPQQEANAINRFYGQYVTPALTGAQTATNNQVTADRAAEGQLNNEIGKYNSTVGGLQDQRMASINYTNGQTVGLARDNLSDAQATGAENKQLASNFIPMAQATSAANSNLADEIVGAARSTNANQTGLYQTLASQNLATNANQTGLYNTLAGQAASINANQTGLYNTLAGQNAASNSQQNAILSQYMQQISQLNGSDRAAYMKYLTETDPQMAQLIAQGSDPADVANQRDVVSRYKELSSPQVTAQERLIANLARQKFESDDRSNREALMSQLAGRGLHSGGLVIAGQQAQQQQLGNDRLNAELGLQANAVSRSMEGLQGYSSASNSLRNADDAMRNFQDVYKQNEARRVSDLALDRNQQSLNTNQNIGARNESGFYAGTTTVNNNAARNQSTFNAGTTTNDANYGRDQSVFNAGTTTNQDNSLRNQSTYNAGTGTNQDNYYRTSNSLGTKIGENSNNYMRDTGAILGTMGTNSENYNRTSGARTDLGTALGGADTRFQGGLDAGGVTAGNQLAATSGGITFGTGNRAAEAQTAQGLASTMSGAGQNFASVQQGLTGDQIAALQKALGFKSLNQATALAQN